MNRKHYTAAFKVKIVMESLRETKTLSQIAAENELSPALVTRWRTEAVAELPQVFERRSTKDADLLESERKIAELYEQIGRLTTQVSWLKKNLASTLTRDERIAFVERENRELTLTDQADLLSLSRSGLYYQPRPAQAEEVRIKHRLDELYTEYPFLGSRKVVPMLAKEGLSVSRHTIRRYRQEMGLVTLYPKPKLSSPGGPESIIYPYLLRGLPINRPDQVWGQAQRSCRRVDITYIRMVEGWMYLVAFLDWYSRYVIAWELSDTLELPFVLTCADAALAQRLPEIVNSDQGSHFTSSRFTERFRQAGVRVSMDGRGRYVDNIFTERLWRTVKYEEVYTTQYESPRETRRGLGRYLNFYNERRPHQALGNKTPAEIYHQSSQTSDENCLNADPSLS